MKESARLEISDEFPVELSTSIETIFNLVEDWLPNWCSLVYIQYSSISDDDDYEDVPLECITSYQYRRATIFVYSPFFELPPLQRLQSAIHEVVHILCAPEQEEFDSFVGQLEFGQGMDEYLKSKSSQAQEATTEDITNRIMAHMLKDPAVQDYLNKLERKKK